MRDELPSNHGLPDFVVKDAALMPKRDGRVSITEAQHAALEAGAATGRSLLVVAPTSTGKTHIAAWAIIGALARRRRAVYLVTHRALARQKFEDLQRLLLSSALDKNESAIVLATGDEVVDAEGALPAAPLEARLLVATYEKYLGLLAASGIPSDLKSVAVICDEVQIVGDPTRGRNAEILLTLLRQAKCGQFVGLSATIAPKDGDMVATWMAAKLVRVANREKNLAFELRAPRTTYVTTTDDRRIRSEAAKVARYTIAIVRELKKSRERLPIIVFCATKAETYELATQFEGMPAQQYSMFGGEAESNVESLLVHLLKKRCAIHNADLTEEVRREIETKLSRGEIDVVFSTSTLAAGVHFPIATAVIASWRRWSQTERRRIPISHAEFHNMAGRAGRLGVDGDQGLVVFACDKHEIDEARTYLDFDATEPFASHLDPNHFDGLALQLIAFGFCTDEQSLMGFLDATLSAKREIEINRSGIDHWREDMKDALAELGRQEFVEGA